VSDTNGVVVARNPLDIDHSNFTGSMSNREKNRNALIEWCSATFKEKVDYGKVVGNKKSLLKPGAEKILVILGLKPIFPNLHKIEEAGSGGVEIENIVLECQIVTADDYVVGVGVGGRQVSRDRGDLNKALKMAKKSAMIDATLTCCGLSEQFTQDMEEKDKKDDKKLEKDDGSTFPQTQKKTPVKQGNKVPTKSEIIIAIKSFKNDPNYDTIVRNAIGKRSLDELGIPELKKLGKELKEKKGL
jgi:hypothetical protein